MEPLSTQNQPSPEPNPPLSPSTERALEDLLHSSQDHTDTIIVSANSSGKPIIHRTKNLYPVVRHVILVIIVLLFITLIIFLMHQNGKSIYDNGL